MRFALKNGRTNHSHKISGIGIASQYLKLRCFYLPIFEYFSHDNLWFNVNHFDILNWLTLFFSLDRLEIFYNRFDSVVISPEDKAGFIAELTKLNPEIEVT